MDRSQEILRHIPAGTRGIEIAPWCKPIVANSGDREVLVLDLFDRPTLIARAVSNPNIDDKLTSQISAVDLVGSACKIAELIVERFGPESRFDFVVSSHNLEHLPDPIRFLRGCEAVLAPGGIVALAIPDKRACFDYFRPLSSTGEMLLAFHEQREQPSRAQIFNQGAYMAHLRTPHGAVGAFSVDDDPNQISLLGDLKQQYERWTSGSGTEVTEYCDVHCWTFTPSSLELILTELILLDIIHFDIISVSKPRGCEFIVQLRKRAENGRMQGGLAGNREFLLKKVVDELAYASCYAGTLRGQATGPCPSIFMIHIPKTAGETINHLMTEMLGGESVRTHIESTQNFLGTLRTLPGQVKYVSGHHRLPDVLTKIDRHKWFVFASLRNPVHQLLSHLKWVKALGDPNNKSKRSEHVALIRDIADRLWEIPLGDIHNVYRIIYEEFNEAKQLFDNCQVRYLISYRDRTIAREDAVEAVDALSNLDYVGLTETIPETRVVISEVLRQNAETSPIPVRNKSRLDEFVDLSDPAILDFYREAVRWDAFLYRAAQKYSH